MVNCKIEKKMFLKLASYSDPSSKLEPACSKVKNRLKISALLLNFVSGFSA